MFYTQPKTEMTKFLRDKKHWALADRSTSGTVKLQNVFSLRALMALIVALVMVSLTQISQTNLEKASTQTRRAVFPALLRGIFPT